MDKNEYEKIPEEMGIPPHKIKALANRTRLTILKTLDTRRYTVSELSKILDTSRQRISYHMVFLQNSGYVKKVADNRKWVYYELTELGKSILKSKMIRLLISFIIICGLIVVSVKLKLGNKVKNIPTLGSANASMLVLALIGLVFSMAALIYFLWLLRQDKI